MIENCALLVVGGGLRGLVAGLQARRAGTDACVVERLPYAGGTARTLRSEGFACELGPFALAAAELAPMLALLGNRPPLVGLCAAARRGWRWDGHALEPATVTADPQSGHTGVEDLVTALRRELGALRLGREVVALRPTAAGWTATLGGEVPAELTAASVRLCLGVADAARLLSPYDPALGEVASRLRREPRAFVFLGTWQDAACDAAWRGYGIVCADPSMPVVEVVHCSNAFPRRAMPGKALTRIELAGDAASDRQRATAIAEAGLRRLTGWSGPVIFARVHPFDVAVSDGAHAECRVRLMDLGRRLPGLAID